MHHTLGTCLLTALGILLALIPAISTPAQNKSEVFEDPDGKYKLTLSPGWQAVTSRDGLGRTQVEIVYNVRENGLLRIRRIAVEPGTKVMDLAKREEQNLNFTQAGYAKSAIENFVVPGITAALVSYDFTVNGRPAMGINYYLLVNETTAYLLRFTGARNTLGPIRNQTDAIARSFKAQ